MKFQKAKEIYKKYLVLENIDPTLVSYYIRQQEFYLNQGITIFLVIILAYCSLRTEMERNGNL